MLLPFTKFFRNIILCGHITGIVLFFKSTYLLVNINYLLASNRFKFKKFYFYSRYNNIILHFDYNTQTMYKMVKFLMTPSHVLSSTFYFSIFFFLLFSGKGFDLYSYPFLIYAGIYLSNPCASSWIVDKDIYIWTVNMFSCITAFYSCLTLGFFFLSQN